MTAYRCDECQWIGEPDSYTTRGDPASGEAYFVVNLGCPDCGSEELVEVTLCVDCLDDGIDNEATHDDYCLEHAKQNFEPEDMEVFHRDQVQPISPKVKS